VPEPQDETSHPKYVEGHLDGSRHWDEDAEQQGETWPGRSC